MPQSAIKFYALGLLVASLEEFITQGVLKNNSWMWIIATPVAFLPFLILMRFIGKYFHRKNVPAKATLAYYLTAGGIGLMVEWFIIGLSPWSAPIALIGPMIVLQLGMFSFWGGVAFAPILLLEKRENLLGIRKWYRRFLTLGILIIYFLTFAVQKENQFLVSIASVILTFMFLNAFYVSYIRRLKNVTAADAR